MRQIPSRSKKPFCADAFWSSSSSLLRFFSASPSSSKGSSSSAFVFSRTYDPRSASSIVSSASSAVAPPPTTPVASFSARVGRKNVFPPRISSPPAKRAGTGLSTRPSPKDASAPAATPPGSRSRSRSGASVSRRSFMGATGGGGTVGGDDRAPSPNASKENADDSGSSLSGGASESCSSVSFKSEGSGSRAAVNPPSGPRPLKSEEGVSEVGESGSGARFFVSSSSFRLGFSTPGAGDGIISAAGGIPDGAPPGPENVPGTPGGNKPGETPTPGGMSPAGNTLCCPSGVPPPGWVAAAAFGPLSENASTYFDRPFCARMLNGAAAAIPGDAPVPGDAAGKPVPAAGDAPSVVGGGGGGPASVSPSLPGSTQRPSFSS
mmetsp:Transcript_14245/g.60997  ORF Transcript_14245/g.60997 Transcript_14245/m.60997 type:complete len:378 (-) Transcript_14245:2524-3657(-)